MTGPQHLDRTARLRRAVRGGARYLRHHPFSSLLAVVVLVCGAVLSTPHVDLLRFLGAGPITTATHNMWWTPVTALLVPQSILEALLAAALAVTVMAYVESLMGTVRTVLVFFAVGIVSILVGVGVHVFSRAIGTPLLLLSRADLTLDPAIGIFGVLMTGSAFAPVLLRRRIRVIGLAVVLTFALYAGDQDSSYRVIAALVGLGLGALLRASRTPSDPSASRVRGGRRSSYGEARTLVAAVVAVTGIGPVIVLLDRTLYGPLALVVSGFAQVDRDGTFSGCVRSAAGPHCAPGSIHAFAHGVGPVLLSLVPVVLSLIAAWGLRAGRRAAWTLAVVVQAVTLVSTAVAVGFASLLTVRGIEQVGERFALAAFLAVGVPAAVLVVLVVARRRFQLATSRAAVRRFSLVVGAAFVLILVVWGVTIAIDGRVRFTLLGARVLFAHVVRVFLPAGFTRGLPSGGVRMRGIGVIVNEWAGIAFWLVFVVAILMLLRAATHAHSPQAERFRALLREAGGGTLGFMGTWDGVAHWISDDGRAAVAYREIGGVALAIADPVCRPEDLEGAVGGFIAYCDRHGWTPVFYSTHGEMLPAFGRRGWHWVSIGEETVVRLPGLELTGGRWKRVRQALAKAERLGIETVWTRWSELPVPMALQIEALSEQWVAEKALPELGFTLGGLAELRDPDVALLLAVGADGTLQAVTSWLPSWRNGRLDGWTLDFMRRSDGAMPEIMVHLIASAALRMRDDGVQVMSLSGAPLATKPASADAPAPAPGLLARLLAWLGDVLEPVYGFRSLFEFKQKFHPELRTIYMVYTDAASLPAAGRAITRAYMPEASAAQTLGLIRMLSGGHRTDDEHR